MRLAQKRDEGCKRKTSHWQKECKNNSTDSKKIQFNRMMMLLAKYAMVVCMTNNFKLWINVVIPFTKTAWFKPSKLTSAIIISPYIALRTNASCKSANLILKAFWEKSCIRSIKTIP